MAKGVYVGVDGVAKKVKSMYIGVDGIARKIKKAYIGVDNIAKLIYEDAIIIPISITLKTKYGLVSAIINGETFSYDYSGSSSKTKNYSTEAPIGSIITVPCKYGGGVWLYDYTNGSNSSKKLKTASNSGSSTYDYTIPEGVTRATVTVQWTSSSEECNSYIYIYDY